MDLIFATNNSYKFNEIKKSLNVDIKLLSLSDVGFHGEIPETHNTLEENAAEKANFIYNKFQKSCFADDTGLEIEALNGEPGVFSARYAGNNCTFDDNMNKVLRKMLNIENRKARFRTVIAYIEKGKLSLFEGVVNGTILKSKIGKKGFGYDPIFQPEGYNKTFAEMDLSEKNAISHRTDAFRKFVNYIHSSKLIPK